MAWTIKDNQIRYITETQEEKSFPSADIYKAFSTGRIGETDTGSPSSIGLHASKISSSYQLVIDYIEGDKIFLKAVVRRKGSELSFACETKLIPDSLVIDNSWFSVSASRSIIEELLSCAEISHLGHISLTQYIKLISILPDYDIDYCDLAAELIHNQQMSTKEVSVELNADLYPYQQVGLNWLTFMAEQGCGCILADEMGLGKTLQIIALITHLSTENDGRYLIVAPVSLLENWKREIDKFTSGLNVCIHHGANRTGRYKELLEYDITIISYNTAISDYSLLHMIDWDLVVLDEAQNIKNPAAQRTKFIKKIPRKTGVAVTGTPFENHMSDLWSIMDFAVPGCMGALGAFEDRFKDDLEGARTIEPVLSPIMIRRMVKDVAQDLPDRVDVPQPLRFNELEAFEYEELRRTIINQFDGKNAALPMLQKLRMFCTHPSLIERTDTWIDNPRGISTKFDRLMELMEEIVSLKEKAIIFTSYNDMFPLIKNTIEGLFHIPAYIINGSTPTEMRQEQVDKFTAFEGAAAMVLNPRAAGTGLNITAATRVIHYNLEWNPALEDQASARAYRRGQTNTVFVYRLFYENSVEAVINERIEKKRDMFDSAITGIDGSQENREDIVRALMLSPEVTND